MAQKLRATKEIASKEFDRLMEDILNEDKELLKILAKV
jgi:hypothetical protein